MAADFILVDIGAGATFNNLDFFNMADMGIIVMTPEPTAILSGYEFLKMAVRRKILAAFSGNSSLKEPLAAMLVGEGEGKVRKIGEVIGSMREIDPDAAQRISSLVGWYEPAAHRQLHDRVRRGEGASGALRDLHAIPPGRGPFSGWHLSERGDRKVGPFHDPRDDVRPVGRRRLLPGNRPADRFERRHDENRFSGGRSFPLCGRGLPQGVGKDRTGCPLPVGLE